MSPLLKLRRSGLPVTGPEPQATRGSRLFEGRAATQEQRLLGLMLLGLAVIYGLLAHAFNGYQAFWSADSGARFAMIQSWIHMGRLTSLQYANSAVDPAGQIHPLGFYLVHGPRGFCLTYPPAFSLWSGLMYRVFGFAGLTLLPLVAGVGTVWVTFAVARRLALRSRLWLPLVMGLATPLVVYSVVFWDHSLIMLLAICSAHRMLRALESRQWHFAVQAGATLGAGLWIHELLFLLFVALLLAAAPWLRKRKRRPLAFGMGAGFLPFLGLWLLGNRLIYGLWGGPHVAVNMGHTNPLDHAPGLAAIVSPAEIIRRMQIQLLGTEAAGSLDILLILVLTGVVLTGWWGRRAHVAASLLCLGAALLALVGVRCQVASSGLFAVTPLLVPALVIPPSVRRLLRQDRRGVQDRSRSAPGYAFPVALFYAWLSRACGLFAVLVFLNPVLPGMNWGSRYLLTVLPFLVLLAMAAAERQYQRTAVRWRGPLAGVVAVIIGISLFSQECGLVAVRNDLRYSGALNRSVRAVTSPVLVTDIFWLGPELTPAPWATAASPLSSDQFLVRSAPDRLLFAETLHRRNIRDFTYMGTAVGLPVFARAVARGITPFQPVSVWQNAGLQFARFVPQAAPPHRVLALYYPWYATPSVSGHWAHQDGLDLAHKRLASHTHFPALGPYDSADPAVLDRHLAEAKASGIDTLVCSWWGPGDMTDANLRRLVSRAPSFGLTVCAYWEHPSHPGDPKATEEDLAALLKTMSQEPGYLKVNGKPVVFLYAQTCRSLAMGQWVTLLQGITKRFPPGVLTIGDGLGAGDLAIDDLLVWDGWHTLEAPGPFPLPQNKATLRAAAQQQRDLFALPLGQARYLHRFSVETVEPGFDERKPNAAAGRPPGPTLDRQGGALYQALWEQAIRDKPDWVLINSFNEWHNGTEIEPSVEEGDRFLTLTREEAALMTLRRSKLRGICRKVGLKAASYGVSPPERAENAKTGIGASTGE